MYVWTKKAEEVSAAYGITRKEGEPATVGYEPIENCVPIRIAWLEAGYIVEVERGV